MSGKCDILKSGQRFELSAKEITGRRGMGMSNFIQKKYRVLDIYQRLMCGEYVSVKKLAEEYEVSPKSISRDISELKNFLYDSQERLNGCEILYSYQEKAYYLKMEHFLWSKELLAVLKILIASRALSEAQMKSVIKKMESFMTVKDKVLAHELVLKELYHYMPVGADCENVLDHLWGLSQCIREQKEITIEYYKMDRSKITRRVKPLSIVFSEYYFYLIASHSLDGKEVNRFYRIDRIVKYIKHRTGFQIPYKNRFDEGALKNKIQYMWPGQGVERTVVFEFHGPSVQAVLDRLPGAEIIKQEGGRYTVRAKVYGDGIKMFLLSQGAWVKVLEPASFVQEMKEEIQAMQNSYDA